MSKIDDIYELMQENISGVLKRSRQDIIRYIQTEYDEWNGDIYYLIKDYISYHLAEQICDALYPLTNIEECLDIDITVKELR